MSAVYVVRLSLVGIAAGIFAAAIAVALDFPTMAAYLPIFAAGAGLVVCVGQLWEEVVLLRHMRKSSLEGTNSVGDAPTQAVAEAQYPDGMGEPEAPYRAVFVVLMSLYLYVGAVVMFGFLVPSAVMLLLTFRFRSGAGWAWSALAVILILLGILSLTSYARIVLPDGLLI